MTVQIEQFAVIEPKTPLEPFNPLLLPRGLTVEKGHKFVQPPKDSQFDVV